jgi:hypothetical protein
MKIKHIDTLRVNNNGMDAVLTACGYPSRNRMEKWDWQDWDMNQGGENFVKDAAMLELEFKLKGIRARDLNPTLKYKPENDDDMYDEYLDWKERKSLKTFRHGCFEISIAKWPDGYLATINRLDDDGNGLYGCTGDYANTAIDAAYDAVEYYHKSWDDGLNVPAMLLVDIKNKFNE